jgi:hypothetical protein
MAGIAEVEVRPNPAPEHVRRRRAERLAHLRLLGYASYGDYLRSPHWLRTRQRYLESDLPQTCVCGDWDIQLHHMTYERVGAEELSDLTPLCRRCHSLVHVLEWRREIGLDLDGLCDGDRALAGRKALTRLVQRSQGEREAAVKEHQREVLAKSFAQRVLDAKRVAIARRVHVSPGINVLKMMVRAGKDEVRLTRQLRLIEERAYGWEGWASSG